MKNAWVLEKWPRFRGCTPNPITLHEFAQFLGCESSTLLNLPLCMNLPRYGVCDALPQPHPCLRTCISFTHFSLGPSAPSPLGPVLPTLRSHLYCCSYAMKPDGRRANHIIVEESWPYRKATLIISVKLQPNVTHSQLGVVSVRNRISRLKKRCIIKPIWRIMHFVDQQTINAWWIRPLMLSNFT